MRSPDTQEVALYSYISPEQRVPADHPLRPIREMVNAVLRTLSPEFNKIYSIYGRPSARRQLSWPLGVNYLGRCGAVCSIRRPLSDKRVARSFRPRLFF